MPNAGWAAVSASLRGLGASGSGSSSSSGSVGGSSSSSSSRYSLGRPALTAISSNSSSLSSSSIGGGGGGGNGNGAHGSGLARHLPSGGGPRLAHSAAAAVAAQHARAAPQPAPAPGVLSALHSAVTREGLLAPYKGMSLSLPGVVVYTSVSFTAYDTLKHLLPGDKNSKEAWWYPFAKMGCGAAAGVAAQTCSYPLDTLRRRMQVSGAPGTQPPDAANPAAGDAAARQGRPPRPSYASLLRALARSEGGLLRGLFRGWSVNAVKIVPGAAVQFVAYDALRVGVTFLDPASGAQSPL